MGNGDGDDVDPFEELYQELRERVGGEFRRTAEEDEHTARKAALRRRDLAQVAFELLSRGDTVRIKVGGMDLRGIITHARGTLATLQPVAGAAVHVNLSGPVAFDVVIRSTDGGGAPEPFGPETFLARLRELELAAVPVEVLLGMTPERPRGVIEAVAQDHLMLSGETTYFLPLAWIGGVRRVVAR